MMRRARCCTLSTSRFEHLGRNLHFLLAREAIENRHVKLLVVEVADNEPRDLHPAFAALADPSDILFAPVIVNISYLSDLSRLPLRQVSLFLRSVLPATFDAQRDFIPEMYRGAHWDDTYASLGSPQYPVSPVVPRLTHPTPAEMALQRQHYERLVENMTFAFLPFPRLMRRANLYYVNEIAKLARQRGVALCFLYLPDYGAPPEPVFADLYRQLGPIWYPGELLRDPSRWLDVNHLNYEGATVLARWLAAKLSEAATAKAIARTKSPQGTAIRRSDLTGIAPDPDRP